MFWSSPPDRDDLREEIRELVRHRLRLALDFATLGAYELAESKGYGRIEPPAAPQIRCSSPISKSACGDQHRRLQRPARDHGRGRTRSRRHRGGSVSALEQPCLCADNY